MSNNDSVISFHNTDEWREYLLKTKHAEAEFFLDKMENLHDHDVGFYLSAFLGAIYTISDFMSDYAGRFDEWSNVQAHSDIHNFMMDNRNNLAHLNRPSAAEPQFERIPLIYHNSVGGPIHMFTSLPDSFVEDHDDMVVAEMLGNSLMPVYGTCNLYFRIISDWILSETDLTW